MVGHEGGARPNVRPGSLSARHEGREQREGEANTAGPLAACSGSTEIFYGNEVDLRDEPPEERKAREQVCKEICAGCAIRQPCLWWSIENLEEYGVWGGVAFRERKRFRKWLAKQNYTKIPEGDALDEALEEFRQEEAGIKRKNRLAGQARAREAKQQPIAKIIKASSRSRVGIRSVDDRVRSRGAVAKRKDPSQAQVQDVPRAANGRAQASTPRAASTGQVHRRR
jgi:hypothetical protein